MISLLEESGFTELSAAHRGESGVIVLKAPHTAQQNTEEFVPVHQFKKNYTISFSG